MTKKLTGNQWHIGTGALVLVLIGCASGPATRYEQAAPAVRPIPWRQTYTSPPAQSHVPAGAGASHGGLPRHEEDGVQRSNRVSPNGEHDELRAVSGDGGRRASPKEVAQWWSKPEGIPDSVWQFCKNDVGELLMKNERHIKHWSGTEQGCAALFLERRCGEEFFHPAVDEEDVAFAVRWPGVYDEKAFQSHMNMAWGYFCKEMYDRSSRLRDFIHRLTRENHQRWEHAAEKDRAQGN